MGNRESLLRKDVLAGHSMGQGNLHILLQVEGTKVQSLQEKKEWYFQKTKQTKNTPAISVFTGGRTYEWGCKNRVDR